MLLYLFVACAEIPKKSNYILPTIETVNKEADRWWRLLVHGNENYYFSKEITVTIHLCGSRKELARRFPTYDPNGSTYMFISQSADKSLHIWMVVKEENGVPVIHPWAFGHEMIHTLTLYNSDLTNPDER